MLFARIAGIFGFIATITMTSQSASAQLPLLPNQAVTTFSPYVNADGFVVGIYDIRNPDCNGVPVPTCTTASQNPPCISNWPAPQYHNEMPNPTNNAADVWNATNLGIVFGLELDNDPNPNIYVTSTSLFFNGSPDGRIMKIDGTTGAITPFATLPNNSEGLGNIAFDPRNRQFYVTNYEDGKIYRLSFAGAIIDTYDPFAADDNQPGYAPLGERLWGIQVNRNDGRLYFGRWTEDAGRPGSPNQVWSIALNANGSFNGPELLEVTLPPVGPNCPTTQPVADLAFSESGNMLVGTRGMNSDNGTFPHISADLQYAGGHLAWALTNQYDVGLYLAMCGRTNSAGGVDYTDCVEDDECNPGDLAIFMADALDLNSPGPNPNNIYGLQITPVGTGSLLNSYYVDLDDEITQQDKTGLGDVDVVRTCVQPPLGTGACCISATGNCINAISQVNCVGQGGRYGGDGSTCATVVFNPPCGQTPSANCCFLDGTCGPVPTTTVCLGQEGIPLPGSTTCTTPQACCQENETCIEIDPFCCQARGGTPRGVGSHCNDVGLCCEADGDCGSSGGIPTMSQWGIAILALALLIGAKVMYSRRPAAE